MMGEMPNGWAGSRRMEGTVEGGGSPAGRDGDGRQNLPVKST